VSGRHRIKRTRAKYRGRTKKADNLVMIEEKDVEFNIRPEFKDCEFLGKCGHPPGFRKAGYWCNARYFLCSLWYRLKNGIDPKGIKF